MKYIALLLFAAPAFGDVYVYDSAGQATGQKPVLAADDIVRRCYQYSGPEITPGTHTGCAAYEHAPASTVADWGWLYTTDGWCRRRDLPCAPPAPVFQFSGYPCEPEDEDQALQGEEGTAGAAIWYCDRPHVISLHWYCGNPANRPKSTFGKLSAAIKLWWAFKPISRECTDAEMAIVRKLDAEQGIKISVAPILFGDRPIYKRNDDNTQGPVIKGVRAKVGEPCGRKRLQTLAGKPTNYFAFGDGFTYCKVDGEVIGP